MPCFRISEEGVGILITHARADKKNAKRISRLQTDYAKQFTAMRSAGQIIDQVKLSERKMTDALLAQRQLLGKDTFKHHYMNENKMVDRIVLGCTIEEYRQRQCHADGKDLRDLLDAQSIEKLLQVRSENQKLIEQGLSYQIRKEHLLERFAMEPDCIEGTVLPGIENIQSY